MTTCTPQADEIDLPCPVNLDRQCHHCGNDTGSIRWRAGQPTTWCCKCRRVIGSTPRRWLARQLSEQSARRGHISSGWRRYWASQRSSEAIFEQSA